MLRLNYIYFALILLLFNFAGCIGTRTHVIGLHPQAEVIKYRSYKILGTSEGQSSSFNLFWFIPVTPRINYNEAVDEAITKLGGDNLIEVKSWIKKEYWIVGTVNILKVKGTVILYDKNSENEKID